MFTSSCLLLPSIAQNHSPTLRPRQVLFSLHLASVIIPSLTRKKKWYQEARDKCGPKVPIFLVGCKSDLRAFESVASVCFVPAKEAEVVANQLGARYYECSARSREGLDDLIEDAARASLEDMFEQRDDARCLVC